jgi:hypothetical protein
MLPVLDRVELLLPLPGPLLEEHLVVPVLDGGLQASIPLWCGVAQLMVRRGSVMVRRGSVMVRHGSVMVGRGSVMVRRGSVMVRRGSVMVRRGSVMVWRGSDHGAAWLSWQHVGLL